MVKKFEKLVNEKLLVQHSPKPNMYSPYLAGGPDFWKNVPGAVAQFAFYYVEKTGMFNEGPHTHKAEEYLMFLSTDPKDQKSLGATVEIAFGEEWEKYSFDYATFVRFPRGLIHCPVYVRRLERPFLIGHFWPGGEPAHFDDLH